MKTLNQIILLLIGLTIIACQKDNQPFPDQEKAFVKYYGHLGNQVGTDLIETTDGNFLILGNTTSFGANGKDLYLLKVDRLGNEIWSNTYGGLYDDRAVKVIEQDGGYLILGESDDLTFTKIMLLEVDRFGNLTGDSSLVFRQGSSSNEFATDIAIAPSGEYVVLATTTLIDRESFADATTGDSGNYICVLDANKAILWENTFGGDALNKSMKLLLNDEITAISRKEIPNHTSFNLTLFDYDKKLVKSGQTYPVAEVQLSKHLTCSKGQELVLLWKEVDETLKLAMVGANLGPRSNTLSIDSTENYTPIDLIPTTDGGFILSSTVEKTDPTGTHTDIRLTKLNSEAAVEWETTYGYDGNDEAGNIIELADGYLLTATVNVSSNTMTTLIRTNTRGELLRNAE